MRLKLCVWIAVIVTLSVSCTAQVKRRIAVFPFDDRTTANKDMNIGTKVADLLIANLTNNGAFTVYDRQYIDRILAEKNLKYDPNYDSAAAAKSGLMGTVDMVISGQIDAFNPSTSQSSKGMIKRTTETDGSVKLKVTARLISVERGAIVIAPTASNDQAAVLAKIEEYHKVPIPGTGTDSSILDSKSSTDVDQKMRELVDKAAEEVSKELSSQLAQSAMSLPMDAAPAPVKAPEPSADPHPSTAGIKAAFLGIDEGQAFIDKGSEAGIKVGDKFIIRRSTDTGLKDGAGQAIMRRKPICTLTIASVEETSAAGKCVPGPTAHGPDGVPHKGDEVVAAK